MREVDEELRKERLNRIVSRYGWAIVGAVVLAARRDRRLHLVAEPPAGTGRRPRARPCSRRSTAWRAATATPPPPRSAARRERRRRLSRRRPVRARLHPVRGGPERGRDRHAEVDRRQSGHSPSPIARPPWSVRPRSNSTSCSRSVVIQRLGPLARPGQPWFGTAGEMVGIAHLQHAPARSGRAAVRSRSARTGRCRRRSVQGPFRWPGL